MAIITQLNDQEGHPAFDGTASSPVEDRFEAEARLECLKKQYKSHFDSAIIASAVENLGIKSTEEMLKNWSHQYPVYSKEFEAEDIEYVKHEHREAYKKFDFLLGCIPDDVEVCRVFFADCLDVLDKYMKPSKQKGAVSPGSSSTSDAEGEAIGAFLNPSTAWD